MITNFMALADKAINGINLTTSEALSILQSTDTELMQVVAAASQVRHFLFGNKVKLNYLVNLKSGKCPEDCFYCSQRLGSKADILKYFWLKKEEAVNHAVQGISHGAGRVCLVASGTKPTDRDINRVTDIVTAIKNENRSVEICACFGFLTEEQGATLRAAGVDAYNHNLNTPAANYENVCSTHNYADRVNTVNNVQKAGLAACSGFIAGMGETDTQLVELAFDLHNLRVESIPVNFLLPFDGTPMEGKNELSPTRCIRILAMVRLVCNRASVRIAAGRESHLKSLQSIGFQIANSIFLGDYLTSEGQAGDIDREIITDWGFEIENPTPVSNLDNSKVKVVPRKRGAGTTHISNV